MTKQWGRHGRFNIETAKARFTSKTQAMPNGCINWVGSLNRAKYGSLGMAGKPWLAHRAAWLLFKGEDPGDLFVCHRCDNRQCVNIEHLFLGTQEDNMRDMERKGRSIHYKGEMHGRAKLTWDQVSEIRARHAAGESMRSLARAYPVHRTSIKRIVKNTGWLTT